MKKLLLSLSIAAVTFGTIQQPVQAAQPGHYESCTCTDCYIFDELLSDWYYGMTDAMLDGWKSGMNKHFQEEKPEDFHNPNSEWYISPSDERYIPLSSESDIIHETMSSLALTPEYILYDDVTDLGWMSNILSFWAVFDAVNIYNDIQSTPSWGGWYPSSMYAVEDLLEQHRIYSRTVEMKDMKHIHEALSNSDGTVLVMDIDPNFIPDPETREIYLSDYPDFYKGGVSTVVVHEITYDPYMDCVYIGMLDPYAQGITAFKYLTQEDFRGATIGAGLHDMIVVDTHQDK